MMAVNVGGVWLAARAVVPTMQAQRWGRIVNISSVGGDLDGTYTEIERAAVSEAQKRAMIQQQSIKRPETPADLAGVVTFLCSVEAGFITGQTVNVDGGFMML
jgi:NAD(P)-dependent dehydrogenase (short-subunit alcohol dehydrogenase family)